MDDFFEELDSELGQKKISANNSLDSAKNKPVKPSSPEQKRPAPRGNSPQASNPQASKLTLKKSPGHNKGKLRLKQERVSTPTVSTASTRAGIGKPSGRGSRARTISAPTQFPTLAEPVRLPPLEKGASRFVPIGGLRTVGANMNMLQYGDEILLVDGGLEFARE